MPTPSPSQERVSAPLLKRPAVSLLAGLIVGAIAGYGAASLTAPSQKKAELGFDAGYEAARAKLKESGLFVATPSETNVLSGVIGEVSDGSFTLQATSVSLNPLDAVDAPAMRTVTVSEATEIYRFAEKDPLELQAEFERFNEAADPEALPPEPFTRESADFSELKPGMLVSITADHNIFSETTFEAIEVSWQSGPALPDETPSQ